MPVLVEPDNATAESLLAAMPHGTHAVGAPDRLLAWLELHADEYLVVLGPHLDLDTAVAVCEDLRVSRPAVSVVLVRTEVDVPVLTRAIKAGARDVVEVSDATSIDAAVRRAHEVYTALRGPGGAAHVGEIVTVFSPKGGVGKTTVAVNLALALTEQGARKVCLLDLDLAFGDVAITMQLFPTHSIEHAVGSEQTLDSSMLDGMLTRHPSSVMVLAAPTHPDVRERITPVLVSRTLKVLREEFDYVVVDTAPSFDDLTLTALDETDQCVLVATLDVPTLKNVKVALETLDTLHIAQGRRHLLLNRADDAVGLGPEKVEAILGMPISARLATSVEIAAATNAGNPIVAAQPGHASSQAMLALASQLSGGSVAPPTPAGTSAPEPEGGARKRLFGRKK
ncbi:AAA family ATPase [Nocardioides nanhaiensis]|uniref:Response regulator n=1 Tax=Nocardioides nanhaiensis TaxID=1476871 RepID=A0ABP8WSI6_9ACTN